MRFEIRDDSSKPSPHFTAAHKTFSSTLTVTVFHFHRQPATSQLVVLSTMTLGQPLVLSIIHSSGDASARCGPMRVRLRKNEYHGSHLTPSSSSSIFIILPTTIIHNQTTPANDGEIW